MTEGIVFKENEGLINNGTTWQAAEKKARIEIMRNNVILHEFITDSEGISMDELKASYPDIKVGDTIRVSRTGQYFNFTITKSEP